MQARIVDNSSIRMIIQRRTLHPSVDPLLLFEPAPGVDPLPPTLNPFLLLASAMAPDHPPFPAGVVALKQKESCLQPL